MPLGWTMSESGDHVKYLHFPVSGIVSLIYALEDGPSSEIALVGNEVWWVFRFIWVAKAFPAVSVGLRTCRPVQHWLR